MKLQQSKLLFLMILSLIGLGGCETPQGIHPKNVADNAPSYDAVVYMPKSSPEFYDHDYYHNEIYGVRQ